jgi:ATP-dependent DNA ligase
MRRFGRKLDVAEMRRAQPLRPFFFDILHAGGSDLIDLPAAERIAALAIATGRWSDAEAEAQLADFREYMTRFLPRAMATEGLLP